MTRYIPALAFWAAAVFAFVMAVLPGGPEAPFTVSDKVMHASAFFVLAGLAAFAFRRTALWKIALGLAAFGAGIEIVQGMSFVHRDMSLLDLVADVVGISLSLPFFALVLRRWRATATA